MDLRTEYLGMTLRSPIVPSASPLSEEIRNIRQMEDEGAGAVVLYSLFEEQITRQRRELHHHLTHGTDSFAEALTFFPQPSEFQLGPDAYLEHIRQAKEAVNIPVIASLNGSSLGGWVDCASRIEQAGADALELNIYYIPADTSLAPREVEQRYVEILTAVRTAVRIPIAVKMSPYFSNLAHMAKRLEQAGANGLVLFNRFYQPDIDIDVLEVRPRIIFSGPQDLLLPLTWIGILHGRVGMSLAGTSGIHTHEDVLKMLMAGASVTMMAAALLKNGIGHIRQVEDNLRRWMDEHEYESVRQMQGSMSQFHCPDPPAFGRANYIGALQGYRV